MNTKIKILITTASLALLGAACTPGQTTLTADGGIWLSQDRGENWEARSNIFVDRTSRKTISDLVIKKMVFSPVDTRKIFAVSQNTGLFVSWNGGGNWDLLLPASSLNDVAIAPNNARVIYAAVGQSVAKTENEGDNWKAIYTSDQANEIITAIGLFKNNDKIVLAGTNSGQILVSEDSGLSWRKLTQLSGAILKIAAHPSNEAIIFVGLENAGLASSQDGGKNWQEYGNQFNEFSGANEFRDFAFTPSGIIYASSFGLLRSLDQGAHWVSLPLISKKNDSNIYSLAVDPNNPMEIYYGARTNLYYSLDGGFNWIPRQLPTSRWAASILINPNNSKMIYLGSGGLK